MGFLKNTLKGAVAAKVVSEARKPHNQAKAKSLLSSVAGRFSRRGQAGTAGRPATKRTPGPR
jgi:hypothetical protein